MHVNQLYLLSTLEMQFAQGFAGVLLLKSKDNCIVEVIRCIINQLLLHFLARKNVTRQCKGPGKRGHIVAHHVSWAAQTGKHLLRTQNVSEQNQKHFLYPGHKICVRSKCSACWQTGKHLCRQQCVGNNVCSFARAFNAIYYGET